MKRLTATLCLTLAVLLGSEVRGSDLPPCRGSYHHNCFATYTSADGDKYVGEVRNNTMHGQGTYTSADGGVLEGIFKDGEFQYAQKVSPTVTARKSPPPSKSADLQKGYTAYKSGDYATALREWTPLAEQGNATAQALLGVLYANGKGVPKNEETAVKWYKLAAEQGYAVAQYYLGQMYDEGKGVPQNYKTAVKWHKLAAKQGNAEAQVNLGAMYAYGMGVLTDYVYAHMWGNIAAKNGNENGGKLRDFAAKPMTPSQRETAKKLARECVRKKYKGC